MYLEPFISQNEQERTQPPDEIAQPERGVLKELGLVALLDKTVHSFQGEEGPVEGSLELVTVCGDHSKGRAVTRCVLEVQVDAKEEALRGKEGDRVLKEGEVEEKHVHGQHQYTFRPYPEASERAELQLVHKPEPFLGTHLLSRGKLDLSHELLPEPILFLFLLLFVLLVPVLVFRGGL